MVSCKTILLITLVVLISHIINAKLLINDIIALQNSSWSSHKTVDDVEVFKKYNPDVELEQLNMINNVHQQKVYTLGTRMPGDQLIAQGVKNHTWWIPRHIALSLSYPSNEPGALLTYVYAVVNQSSNIGNAYVSKGGIQERFITLVIEGYGVTFMNVEAKLYGIV